ncbi:MAG: divergent polysaccharide deacetylase family protein [bacterium]|nr:divergent polysaccharide deacetylase family protein [bacterium]
MTSSRKTTKTAKSSKTTKKRAPGKKVTQKKNNSTIYFFALFISIALCIVVLLEYLDFQKGKKSVIFTKIIPLETVTDKTADFNKNFLRVLNKNNILCDYFQDKEAKKDSKIKEFHFKLEINSSRFKGLLKRVTDIVDQLKGELELAEIQGMTGKSIMLYKVRLDNKTTHSILITKIQKQRARPVDPKPVKKKTPVKKPPPPKKTPFDGTPRIAIIIDDIGVYDIGALALKKLDIPITASILPDSPHAREEAKWCKQYGVHTMLHIPMQPKNGNGPTYNSGKTITLNSSDGSIRRLLRRAKKIVPQARGLNNHQGSLVTSNKNVMTRTLKIIKEEGLFFVDSRTIGNTVGFSIAKSMGIKTASKDVFLDHEQSYKNSVSQIKRLVEVAQAKGSAIAIGHPHATTIRAIKDSIKFIKEKGVKIVPVSDLLN